MAALRSGESLNVVMLGDSIINDLCRSNLGVLVERMYPGSYLNVIPSVRGSTGCWWYKEDNRVQEWVLDHDPDLVVIGGISQYDDVDSIRDVIQQIHAGAADCEILLLTKIFGLDTDYTDRPENLQPLDPQGSDYRAALWRLAGEMDAGFVDMTAPYGRCVIASGRGFDDFKRDIVHASYYGVHVGGRIFESYFAPPAEPPSGPGDANADGVVDIFDLAAVASNYGLGFKSWGDGDFSGDGYVNATDLALLANHYQLASEPPSRPGDANRDGLVNVFDLAAVAGNYGLAYRRWEDGDFTGDGQVDAMDLAILANNYERAGGDSAAPAADGQPVPEPATLALLAMGGCLPLLRRRRRRLGPNIPPRRP
jgi:hypothetical protein